MPLICNFPVGIIKVILHTALTPPPPAPPSWKQLLFKHDSPEMQRRSLLFYFLLNFNCLHSFQSDPSDCLFQRWTARALDWVPLFEESDERCSSVLPRSREKCLLNRQVTVGINMLVTSSSSKSPGTCKSDQVARYTLHSVMRSELNWGLLRPEVATRDTKRYFKLHPKRWSAGVLQKSCEEQTEATVCRGPANVFLLACERQERYAC